MKHLLHPELDGLEVKEAEFTVATAEGSDGPVDGSVVRVLQALRRTLGMDVVFVSEFLGGERFFRQVDAEQPLPGIEPGASDPLEESWCQRVVDGRLPEFIPCAADLPAGAAPMPPFGIGTHLSVPVRLQDGGVYGTLCCFSRSVRPQVQNADLARLRTAADLISGKLERTRA